MTSPGFAVPHKPSRVWNTWNHPGTTPIDSSLWNFSSTFTCYESAFTQSFTLQLETLTAFAQLARIRNREKDTENGDLGLRKVGGGTPVGTPQASVTCSYRQSENHRLVIHGAASTPEPTRIPCSRTYNTPVQFPSEPKAEFPKSYDARGENFQNLTGHRFNPHWSQKETVANAKCRRFDSRCKQN